MPSRSRQRRGLTQGFPWELDSGFRSAWASTAGVIPTTEDMDAGMDTVDMDTATAGVITRILTVTVTRGPWFMRHLAITIETGTAITGTIAIIDKNR